MPPHGNKPAKPYPGFPLYAHASGRWAKTIRRRTHYFGTWDQPQEALELFLKQRDALYAGQLPRQEPVGLTVGNLLDHFINAKQRALDAGELSRRTWTDYDSTCKVIVASIWSNRLLSDVGTEDFAKLRAALAKRLGPVALGNEIQRIRTVFKYAFDVRLIDTPMAFGPEFVKPSKKVLRQARQEKGQRLFKPRELRDMLAAARVPLKAMILLGINCGFGNADCGTLPMAALDLQRGWHHYHRPKTGIERRCPLWPETVEALRQSIDARPEPREDAAGLVFVTKYGRGWHKNGHENPIALMTKRLLDELGLRRPGLSFYALRHTFETVAGESADQVAVDHIMGHAREDMASIYRERISDKRLRAVTNRVHRWLFGG